MLTSTDQTATTFVVMAKPNGDKRDDRGAQTLSSTVIAATATTASSNSKNMNWRQMRSYYIDELGFYRHLDPDQRQYVCSNLNDMRPARNGSRSLSPSPQPPTAVSLGDGGFENCSRLIRNDLGISHFDRLAGYKKWKRDWDEFMRDKLLRRETVTFNQALKMRIRTGIPHDYRCKVWTALIIMRTRSFRANYGNDIYETILRDYVHKISVPRYKPDTDSSGSISSGSQNNKNNNNNNINENSDSEGGDEENSRVQPIGGGGSSFVAALEVSSAKQEKQDNSTDFYVNLSKQAVEKIFKQIELDLLRTLPNNRHFEDPNSRGIKRVRRVLRAYACFNPTVGYCQGMNRLAAMTLLVLPEEEAFWCLVAIIQCIMPKDYYLKPWLAQVDCSVLGELLEKKMPKLHKHLVKNDIQLTLFTWFFTIFVDGFRPELMLRIWDCFLLEGDKVLFRVALAILHIAQDDLLGMHDISNVSSYLSQLVSTRKLDTELLFETFNSMNPLSSRTIESRREFHRNRMSLMLEE